MESTASKCFPLRWETTLEQWWCVSPIELAAAHGHYDVVRELLLADNNHLIKLTSLRRIHRLETLWDETDNDEFSDISRCRAEVARELLRECESRRNSPLIRGGYGGWLMYTAAESGDATFVEELLERDPFIIFGEGEYGVTDILYAAAKSKNCKIFKMIFDLVASPSVSTGNDGHLQELKGEIPSIYKWEIMNRAVHAAAKAGNRKILKELLRASSDASAYRDVNGSTVLHSATAKGRVEVIKYLIEAFDMMGSIDRSGNTPLHIAAYRGQVLALRSLLLSLSDPHLRSIKNNAGNTLLHMAVSGFQSPAFQRLDRQLDLVEDLISNNSLGIEEIINIRSNNGRTALHTALIGRVNSKLVSILITIPGLDVNIRDEYGMTALDLLKLQQPRTADIDVLIRQLVSVGAESSSSIDLFSAARSTFSHSKLMQSYGANFPGSYFEVSDGDLFLCASGGGGARSESDSAGPSGTGMSSTSFESVSVDEITNDSFTQARSSSAAQRLKRALCPAMTEARPEKV